MFNKNIARFQRFVPMFAFLFITAVTLAQSEAGSALLSGIQIVINRQPQGF
jgi:hypothetical protein